MDILQPKLANNLQWQRKEQRDCDTSGHLTPSLNHQEPTSIISSLVHDLLDLRQEVNELKLQVTESYRELTPAQREKAQNGCTEPYRMAQQKEITSLQEALTSAGHQAQCEQTETIGGASSLVKIEPEEAALNSRGQMLLRDRCKLTTRASGAELALL
ncbi:hypothetical protein G5714_020859 [Onychostoma macrolepis]|uniref:Uncharacterized protein n=1 Tax=Onychostoma macrolepis TaxID=369639 RepID=A0A7J6BV18_9TELE|nr:hypothetical protein G5714_020859 [Onychostoma macrolepis]